MSNDLARRTRAGVRSRTLGLLVLLLASVLALPLVAAGPAAAVGESTFTNPVLGDAADPTIEYHDGNYYLVATTWDDRVVMRKAATLAALGTAKPVTVYSDTNPGRNGNMWAPELQRLEGPNGWRWYLMYTMGTAGNFGTQHLQVIESAGDDPMGPYTYKGRPLAIDDWNIDGAYLQLNGELFMTWSQFAPDGLQSNYIARMSTPWTATGPLNILSRPVESWETIGMPVNEGPIPLQKDGRTWIVYSASFCGTEDYQLATLEYTGGDPVLAASWTKSDGPVFSKANGVFGPGHNDFFDSPDGTETWNLYHANARADGGCGRERSARAQLVTWGADGEPDFGVPAATTTSIAVPSGERAPSSARVEGARWQIVSRGSGLCAVVDGTRSGDGAGLVQGSCDSARAAWNLDATGDGYLRLVNAATGKSAGPAGLATTNGAALQQSAWVSNAYQQWSVAPRTDGWSTLTNRGSGKLLDLADCSVAAAPATAAGTVLRQSVATGATCQEWTLRPVGTVAVTSVASGKAFDLAGCSTANGAVLQQREWTGALCQTATFTGAANGTAEIHPSSAAQKCLGVTNGSAADGATVTQNACGSAGSAWRVLVANDGTVEFRSASGKALDLSYCSTADGAGIGQWTVLNNDCQRFRLASVAPAVAPTFQLESSVAARCLAGKVYLTVAVRNTDGAPADVTITTSVGTKTVASVAAGANASAAFSTRLTSLPAGSADIAGTSVDGDGRSTSARTASPAISCG